MTNTENHTVESVLSAHGFASIDDAREANVAFGCLGCGSIMSVTPTATSTREQQRDVLHANFVLSCCDDGDEFLI